MKFKNAVYRSTVIIVILILSFLIGHTYSFIGYKADLKSHPRDYSEFVEKYSTEYGVPEYIVYAVILNGSDFKSNFVSDDGRIGLMQLNSESFDFIQTVIKDGNDFGILYDPETNVKYGTYYLSYLYTKYSRWKTVFASYVAGEDMVELWISDPENTDDNGNLVNIVDKDVEKKVSLIEEEAELYRKLYYSDNQTDSLK